MQRTPYKNEEQAKAGRPDHKNKDQDLGTTQENYPKRSVKDLETQIRGLNQRVEGLERKLEAHETHIDELEQAKEGVKEYLHNHGFKSFKKLLDTLDKLEQRLEKLEGQDDRIQDLETLTDQHHDEIARLERKLGTTDQDETDNELEDRGIRKEINLNLINEGKLKRYLDTQIPPIYRDPKTEVEYQLIPDGKLKKVHDPRED